MEKITLLTATLILISKLLFGQFMLEFTYPGGSSLATSQNDARQFFMVQLEVEGYKYVKVDRIAKVVSFYHLNHSFWKSISFAATTFVPPYNYSSISILYISDHLFDLDDEIEFMYVNGGYDTSFVWITQIVNETGSILLTIDEAAPLVKPNYAQQQLPIYNTPSGTKLIVSTTNGDAKVYGLPGHLSNNSIPNITQTDMLGNPNPNPATNIITIPYEIPADEKTGTIIIYDINGNEIKSYIVDHTFNDLTLSTSEFPDGIYLFSLFTSKGQIGSKKMIKVR